MLQPPHATPHRTHPPTPLAGELSYESDAAERLRSELRAVQAEAHGLRNELDAAKLQHMRLQEAAGAAEAAAGGAAQQLEAQRESEGVLQAEALSLRRALAEAQRKLQALASDSGSSIDRRIVTKMLITYFEKDYSGGCFYFLFCWCMACYEQAGSAGELPCAASLRRHTSRLTDVP